MRSALTFWLPRGRSHLFCLLLGGSVVGLLWGGISPSDAHAREASRESVNQGVDAILVGHAQTYLLTVLLSEDENGAPREALGARVSAVRALSSFVAQQGQRLEIGGVDLSAAVLPGLDLRGANLSEAVLVGADLSEVQAATAFAFRAKLRAATLNRADLREAMLAEASLREVNGKLANFQGAALQNADLTDARLAFSVFDNANLSGADLSGADLRLATLHGAKLSGANLSDADLREAELMGADLSMATLKGALGLSRDDKAQAAYWDSSTIWPDGYAPPSAERLPAAQGDEQESGR